MNIKIIPMVVAAAIATTAPVDAAERYSVGAGVGLLYAGLGLNFARQTEKSFGFISVGCLSLGHGADGTSSDCGMGAGYASNQWFTNPKFSLSVFATASYYKGVTYNTEGLGYRFGSSLNYHFQGIQSTGFVGGISTYIHEADIANNNPKFGAHLGYQW